MAPRRARGPPPGERRAPRPPPVAKYSAGPVTTCGTAGRVSRVGSRGPGSAARCRARRRGRLAARRATGAEASAPRANSPPPAPLPPARRPPSLPLPSPVSPRSDAPRTPQRAAIRAALLHSGTAPPRDLPSVHPFSIRNVPPQMSPTCRKPSASRERTRTGRPTRRVTRETECGSGVPWGNGPDQCGAAPLTPARVGGDSAVRYGASRRGRCTGHARSAGTVPCRMPCLSNTPAPYGG